MPSWEPENLFSDTAWYYARYRPQYPEQVIELLVRKYSLCDKSRVLDLGCGTGHVALRLAPYVSEVIAVDPLMEMMSEGKSLTSQKGITNIKWLEGISDNIVSLASEIGEIDLTVLAQAFHWMDQEKVLIDLYPMTKIGGGLAVISIDVPKTDFPDTTWKEVISETVRYWLGDVRKAGTKGTYTHPEKRFETVLSESRFHNLESFEIKTRRTWTVDQLVGFLYSTSSTSIPVLGDRKDGFEADLRRQLAALEPSGLFKEEAGTQVIMVWK